MDSFCEIAEASSNTQGYGKLFKIHKTDSRKDEFLSQSAQQRISKMPCTFI